MWYMVGVTGVCARHDYARANSKFVKRPTRQRTASVKAGEKHVMEDCQLQFEAGTVHAMPSREKQAETGSLLDGGVLCVVRIMVLLP